MGMMDRVEIDRVLRRIADEAVRRSDEILAANARDLSRMDTSNPAYDRLLLTRERIEGIADDVRNVAAMMSPVGEELSRTVRPNGLDISKIRVPFGVVGVIYESRPNVGFDVFSLCFKTSNACVLRGGSDARESSEAIVGVIRQTLEAEGINPDVVVLLPSGRESVDALLNAVGLVDVLIPRGSAALISHVRDHARVPVIETGAGICHTYFDAAGDIKKGAAIVKNAKTRRVSVCNALDTLIVNSARLGELPELTAALAEQKIVIYADPRAYKSLLSRYPFALLEHADEASFGTEFLDYKMSVKTVDTLAEALEHIDKYSSCHSEAIVTEDVAAAETFARCVDAACVYVNASTAFTDGAQFGMGAEIGISTQKLHARGPMALAELTTYKYIVRGDGQVRP